MKTEGNNVNTAYVRCSEASV